MDSLPVSVIIPTKNSESTMKDCLDSVRINNPAEIIIIDNYSTDRTLEIAERYTRRIYYDENKGFNYAQQVGIDQATQEYIAFVDSDVVLPEGTLATLITELEASDCVSMQAKLLPAITDTYWERAAGWVPRYELHKRPMGLSPAVVRRDTVLKYRLDSKVGVGSDYALEMMMKKVEGKLGVSTSAYAYHYFKSDLRKFIRQRLRYGWELAQFIKAYGPWHVTSWPPLSTLYRIVICVINGKPNYIPFFLANGIVQTAGMMKGFMEILGEMITRRHESGR